MTTEAIELLQDLKDYMSSRADADSENFVYIPNEEFMFQQRIDAVLRSATAQTKAEVYAAMIDNTNNPE